MNYEERAAEIAQFVIDNRHSQGYRHNMSSHELFHLIRDKIVEGLKESDDFDLQRLYDWLMDDSREPAQTKFTSGHLRNVAREFEFRLKDSEKWVSDKQYTSEDMDKAYDKGFEDGQQTT